jgi:hypothetical protein
MGGLVIPWWAVVFWMNCASTGVRSLMSFSSIDRSGNRWKNANPLSMATVPRKAKTGGPEAPGQCHQITFVAARAMQQHEWRFGWIGASDEMVGLSWLNHGEVRQRRFDLKGYR